MKSLTIAATVAITLLVATPAHAYSAMVSFEDLMKESEVIVLARVVNVRDSDQTGHERVATATVLERWKAPLHLDRVEYVASPGWFMCDTSGAKAGETVVLFLQRDPSDHRLHIAHFGRGRMPVSREDSQAYAAIYEVTFPPEVRVRQQMKSPHAEVVMLSTLKEAVLRLP